MDFLAWAGPIIGAVVGFIVGQFWQWKDHRLKRRTAMRDQLRIQQEFREKREARHREASDAIPQYVDIRDQYLAASRNSIVTGESHSKKLELQSALGATTARVASLIRERDELEMALSLMESRDARFFELRLRPTAPTGLRITSGAPEEGVVAPAPPLAPVQDPLRVEVEKDRRDLCRRYGREYPP